MRGHINAKQRLGTGREDEYLIRLQLQRKYHAGCLEGAQEPHANASTYQHSPRLGVLTTRHRGRIRHLEAARHFWEPAPRPHGTAEKLSRKSFKSRSSPIMRSGRDIWEEVGVQAHSFVSLMQIVRNKSLPKHKRFLLQMQGVGALPRFFKRKQKSEVFLPQSPGRLHICHLSGKND